MGFSRARYGEAQPGVTMGCLLTSKQYTGYLSLAVAMGELSLSTLVERSDQFS